MPTAGGFFVPVTPERHGVCAARPYQEELSLLMPWAQQTRGCDSFTPTAPSSEEGLGGIVGTVTTQAANAIMQFARGVSSLTSGVP